jgi:hypothetical protein
MSPPVTALNWSIFSIPGGCLKEAHTRVGVIAPAVGPTTAGTRAGRRVGYHHRVCLRWKESSIFPL